MADVLEKLVIIEELAKVFKHTLRNDKSLLYELSIARIVVIFLKKKRYEE